MPDILKSLKMEMPDNQPWIAGMTDNQVKVTFALLVQECYERRIFFPGGASRFVKQIEKEIGKKEGQDA